MSGYEENSMTDNKAIFEVFSASFGTCRREINNRLRKNITICYSLFAVLTRNLSKGDSAQN